MIADSPPPCPALEHRFVPRPFVQHPHPLPDCEPDVRTMLDHSLEDAARPVEIVAGIKYKLDPQPASRGITSRPAAAIVAVPVSAAGSKRMV
jgi:hypothetical protein